MINVRCASVVRFIRFHFANVCRAERGFQLLAFLGGCRPESAALRGSLVGLASGVEAVTEEDATGKTTVKRQPLSAAFTKFVYVVGGIIAALIFRRIRQATRIAAS